MSIKIIETKQDYVDKMKAILNFNLNIMWPNTS